tara:strand:+ start:61 stop:237 length:177 start_codon:yes stop_codon:yes gene_type:complete
MGKINAAIMDFLANGGSSLGYSDDELPELGHFEDVLRMNILVWEYKGMTQEEYYNGSN